MPSLFTMPIQNLTGVGEKRAELFKKLGVHTVGALIRFYPRAYEDWSKFIKIAEAPENKVCCIKATVESARSPMNIRQGMTIFKLDVSDGENTMTVTFFNQQYLYETLRNGGEFLFYGTVKQNYLMYEMASPAVMRASQNAVIHPIYPQTAGLTTKQIENAVKNAMKLLPPKMNDPIPDYILCKYDLCTLDLAIKSIHFPDNLEAIETAKKRLGFEELLVLQLGMAKLKNTNHSHENNNFHPVQKDFSEEFYQLLPFVPTNAQRRAVAQCIEDMAEKSYPMNRLIQGDVGSGKTAVAAAVCYTAVKNQMQCAFMAPTEILAQQHFQSLSSLFQNTPIKLSLLTGSLNPSQKREVYASLSSGETDIVIGTHALISEDVEFSGLGLVITDEQHRFGVAQRAALISKGQSPHIMVMSATPIPRTLALMIFGDLDLSILDELPPGRQKVQTFLIDSSKRLRVYHFLKKHINEGRQCYIVCPLVEQNESELASAEEYIQSLKKTVLKDCRTALLHGKMKPKDKEKIMNSFKNGDIDILISTTVIEVGVDVPNSVIMLIENAERFGLSQLHQLRGRVGRGSYQSYCIMISDNQNENTLERLNVMCQTNDGFEIADEDLRLRGPGDFFGSRQHGLPELKIANFSSMTILEQTQEAARIILENDPELSQKEHRGLNFEIKRLFHKAGNTEQLQ